MPNRLLGAVFSLANERIFDEFAEFFFGFKVAEFFEQGAGQFDALKLLNLDQSDLGGDGPIGVCVCFAKLDGRRDGIAFLLTGDIVTE